MAQIRNVKSTTMIWFALKCANVSGAKSVLQEPFVMDATAFRLETRVSLLVVKQLVAFSSYSSCTLVTNSPFHYVYYSDNNTNQKCGMKVRGMERWKYKVNMLILTFTIKV